MKTLYIEAQKNLKLNELKLKELEKLLPDTIYIAYSLQYKKLAEQIKNKLKKKISGFSQVLGCSTINNQDAVLLIGEARFHALNLAKSGREVFIFDNYTINRISKEEIQALQKKEQGKLSRFLMEDSAGILVSTKPGQSNLNEALKLKERLEKKTYLFLGDNIQVEELENFKLKVYLNTACPRIESGNIIDYKKIQSI